MNSPRTFGPILCAVFLAACSRKSEPAPATPATAANEPSAAPADTSADLGPLLAELTQAVRKYGFEKQKVPASLEELVTAGYLPAMPSAPVGRRFTVDPKTMTVSLRP